MMPHNIVNLRLIQNSHLATFSYPVGKIALDIKSGKIPKVSKQKKNCIIFARPEGHSDVIMYELDPQTEELLIMIGQQGIKWEKLIDNFSAKYHTPDKETRALVWPVINMFAQKGIMLISRKGGDKNDKFRKETFIV